MRSVVWAEADHITRSTRPIEARIAQLEAVLRDSPYNDLARLELARHRAHIGVPTS